MKISKQAFNISWLLQVGSEYKLEPDMLYYFNLHIINHFVISSEKNQLCVWNSKNPKKNIENCTHRVLEKARNNSWEWLMTRQFNFTISGQWHAFPGEFYSTVLSSQIVHFHSCISVQCSRVTVSLLKLYKGEKHEKCRAFMFAVSCAKLSIYPLHNHPKVLWKWTTLDG